MNSYFLLPQIITSVQNILQSFALDGKLTPEAIALAYGENTDVNELQRLEQEFILGDFSGLPTVEILSSQNLNGALGAYTSQLDRIFISQEFLASGSEVEIIAVILEEIGHAIDKQINLVDTQGDEGYIFSALVRGVNLTAQQLASVQQENDRIEIIVDGETVIAEAATIVVDTLVDENDGVGVGTGTSLREAIVAIADGGTITFDDSIANGTITLGGTELLIDKSVTIDGDTDNITVDGNNASRVFNIDDGTTTVQTVNIDSLTITRGAAIGSASADGNGGGIFNDGENLTISNSTISGNSATYYGGGVYSTDGTTTITNSTVKYNSVVSYDFNYGSGGGIYNANGTTNIENSTVTSNFAVDYGGGIYNFNGTINIENSTVTNNSVYDAGGGIFNTNGVVNVSNSNLEDNSAGYGGYYYGGIGGGIFNTAGTANVSNSILSNNYANDIGGGIFNSNGTANIDSSTLSNNTSSSGGAIENILGTLDISNSTLSNNSADFGGGVENVAGTLDISNSTLSDNNATSGGGISNFGTTTISNSTISNNSANYGNGGGIYNDALVNLSSTIIANNTGNDIRNYDSLNASFSLVEDSNGNGLIDGVNGNIIGQDPQLDPNGLQDNGGATQTIALLSTSPALNQGVANGLTTDQRGLSRDDGNGVDIGAFELQQSIINGGDSDDTLKGTDQADIILGNEGSDRILGQGGDDSLNGGRRDDFISGDAGNDTLDGSRGRDRLFGREGNDLLLGGSAKDELFGGVGNDTLEGGVNDDFLFGDEGDDLLIGGKGQDLLRGAEGNDTFFLEASSGREIILDYEDGLDKFQLGSALMFSDLTITQNRRGTDTLIIVTKTNEVLAKVIAQNATDITDSDFM